MQKLSLEAILSIIDNLSKNAQSQAEPRTGSDGKSRLIEAAKIEFSQKGFAGASVLTISERAGVKQPLLNYHFGNKEGLWRAVIENAYAVSSAEWTNVRTLILQNEDPLTRLKGVLASFIAIHNNDPTVQALVYAEAAQPSARFEWMIDRYVKPFHTFLDSILQECIEANQIKKLPDRCASVMITVMLNSHLLGANLIQRLYPDDHRETPEMSLNERIQMLLDILLNGICVNKTALPGDRF